MIINAVTEIPFGTNAARYFTKSTADKWKCAKLFVKDPILCMHQHYVIREGTEYGKDLLIPPGGSNDVHTFGSTVNMMVRPCPTCPFQPVSASAQVTVRVTSRP